MIAIDTNILLRYLLNDDKAQSAKAAGKIRGDESVLVTDVVLTETIWTLKGKKYKLDKAGIVEVINSLFAEPTICFENNSVVWRALNDFMQAKSIKAGSKRKVADFSDALIVNKSSQVARDRGEQFKGMYTFDIAALEIPGAKKP